MVQNSTSPSASVCFCAVRFLAFTRVDVSVGVCDLWSIRANHLHLLVTGFVLLTASACVYQSVRLWRVPVINKVRTEVGQLITQMLLAFVRYQSSNFILTLRKCHKFLSRKWSPPELCFCSHCEPAQWCLYGCYSCSVEYLESKWRRQGSVLWKIQYKTFLLQISCTVALTYSSCSNHQHQLSLFPVLKENSIL